MRIKHGYLKHYASFFVMIGIGFIDYFYRMLFSTLYTPVVSLLIVVLSLIAMLYLGHKYFIAPYEEILSRIDNSYDELVKELAISKDLCLDKHVNNPVKSFESLVEMYKSAQEQHLELVCQLTNTNNMLDQNNKFAKAIVQITSEILSSKDIHSILQLILNKAIEIIPNAQKGSILLYNNDFLEYKAMYGYDIEGLKGFKFSFDEIFQSQSEDIYEPIIIPNVEQFNSKLKKDKFDVLKDTKSFELKSSISCAIAIDNQFYGTINIDNAESNNAFIEEHKPIIKSFAEQIGIALKNAQLIEKILYLSQYDRLTNIYNRAYFEERLNTIHSSCEANNQEYSLVILDMNDLKMVNDNLGHYVGDKLIVTFTQYISSIQQKPEIFARIGGDEFALVYTNKTAEEIAEIMLNIKKHFLTEPFVYNGKSLLNITFGYGVCTYPKEAKDITTLFRTADQRMYKNKRYSKDAFPFE